MSGKVICSHVATCWFAKVCPHGKPHDKTDMCNWAELAERGVWCSGTTALSHRCHPCTPEGRD